MLKSGLLLTAQNPKFASEVSGLEVVSSITKDQHMSIVLRRNIGELTVSYADSSHTCLPILQFSRT